MTCSLRSSDRRLPVGTLSAVRSRPGRAVIPLLDPQVEFIAPAQKGNAESRRVFSALLLLALLVHHVTGLEIDALVLARNVGLAGGERLGESGDFDERA